MSVTIFTRQELWQTIDELPAEVMPELSSFLAYLRFKIGLAPLPEPTAESTEPSAFLLSLVGIGACDETDRSERDEEILATEIDPRRGWALPRNIARILSLDRRDYTMIRPKHCPYFELLP